MSISKETLMFSQLKGSEKQIAFAEKIRKELVNSFISEYNEDLELNDGNTEDEYVKKDQERIDILTSSDSSLIIAKYTQNNF